MTKHQALGITALLLCFFVFTVVAPPPGGSSPPEIPGRSLPTSAVVVQLQPIVTPIPSPIVTPSVQAVYPFTLPAGVKAAWSPDQTPTLDLTGRRYKRLERLPGWQRIELDDTVTVWIRAQ